MVLRPLAYKLPKVQRLPRVGPDGTNDMIARQRAETALANSKELRFYGGIPASVGVIPAGFELFSVEMTGDEAFPAGLTGSIGYCDIAPSATVTLNLKVNGVTVGTGVITIATTDIVWSMASAYDAAASDKLGLYAPSPADASLRGLHYTLLGTKGN